MKHGKILSYLLLILTNICIVIYANLKYGFLRIIFLIISAILIGLFWNKEVIKK